MKRAPLPISRARAASPPCRRTVWSSVMITTTPGRSVTWAGRRARALSAGRGARGERRQRSPRRARARAIRRHHSTETAATTISSSTPTSGASTATTLSTRGAHVLRERAPGCPPPRSAWSTPAGRGGARGVQRIGHGAPSANSTIDGTSVGASVGPANTIAPDGRVARPSRPRAAASRSPGPCRRRSRARTTCRARSAPAWWRWRRRAPPAELPGAVEQARGEQRDPRVEPQRLESPKAASTLPAAVATSSTSAAPRDRHVDRPGPGAPASLQHEAVRAPRSPRACALKRPSAPTWTAAASPPRRRA